MGRQESYVVQTLCVREDLVSMHREHPCLGTQDDCHTVTASVPLIHRWGAHLHKDVCTHQLKVFLRSCMTCSVVQASQGS